MDYVGCTRTAQVTPVNGAHRASLHRSLCLRLGIRKVTTKVPRSSQAKLNVDRELRTSGHTEYGTPCLGRMERNVVGRDVSGIHCKKLPRSTNCEMQAGNRLLSGICKLWEHGMLDGWLADLNTTVGGLARYAACVCYIVLESSARYGVFCCLGKVSGLGKCNSITRLDQGKTYKWEC